MKICIYGAGAIGGYLAVRLALSGQQVTCIARGPHLEAMRSEGLRLCSEDREEVARVVCTDDPDEIGPQDYVIVALKAYSAHAEADRMAPLLGPDTAVVTAQNGIPWWYFYAHGGEYDGTRIATVDPGNKQWELIGPERAIGCVLYSATEIESPGVIRHTYGNRFSLGEPDGSKSPRVEALARVLVDADLRAPVRPRIREEIWLKLWGNLSMNPISALTRATIKEMVQDEQVRGVIRAMMLEAHQITTALGLKIKLDIDQRIDGALAVGDHKTSMLQDRERGKPLEIDAVLGSVQELGRLCGVATPTIDTVLALVCLQESASTN